MTQQQQTVTNFPKAFNNYADEVLYILIHQGETAARELRSQLNKGKWFWDWWGTVSFYKLMAELEDAGIVTYVEKQHFVTDHNDTIQDIALVRHYSPAPIINVSGRPVSFKNHLGQEKKGRVDYQEGHKLFINWLNDKQNIVQGVRFAHQVTLL